MPKPNPMDLPSPVVVPGESVGSGEPRTVSAVPAVARQVGDEERDILGLGNPRTEVGKTAALINKFGLLNVFAAAILGASGIGMTVLWSANQQNVAAMIKLQVEANKQDRDDAKERDKQAREDTREMAKQHREDRLKLWEAQRDLAGAIRDQTRVAEETHLTMKSSQKIMAEHADLIGKLLKAKGQ